MTRKLDKSLLCVSIPWGTCVHECWPYRDNQVTAFDRNPLRRSYFQGSDIEVSDDLSRLTEFDVLLEVTGDPEALDAMLHKSAAGATILLLGLPYARREFTFESIVAYDKTVVGSVGSSAEDFEEAIATLPQIDTSVFTKKVLPLSAFAQAWELARARAHLKVILEVS